MTVLWQSICTFWLCNLFSSSSAIQFTKLIHSKGRKRLRKILRYCLTFLSISVSQVSQSEPASESVVEVMHIFPRISTHIPHQSSQSSPVTSPAAIHSHPMIMMMTRDATTTLTTTTTKTKKMINICHRAALLMCWPSLPIPIPSIHPSNEWWAVALDTFCWQIGQPLTFLSIAPVAVYKLFIYELGE